MLSLRKEFPIGISQNFQGRKRSYSFTHPLLVPLLKDHANPRSAARAEPVVEHKHEISFPMQGTQTSTSPIPTLLRIIICHMQGNHLDTYLWFLVVTCKLTELQTRHRQHCISTPQTKKKNQSFPVWCICTYSLLSKIVIHILHPVARTKRIHPPGGWIK